MENVNAYKVDFFRKKKYLRKNKWHWKITATNGEIVARSTEGFASKQGCENNAMITMESLNEHFLK